MFDIVFLFGYDQGVTGSLLSLPSFTNRFPEILVPDSKEDPNYIHASTIQGIAVASYNLGCLLGAIMTIWLGDMLGRRKMIFVGSIIMVIGATLQCTSFELPQLIVGRIVTGIGNGMNTSTVSALSPLIAFSYLHDSGSNMAIRDFQST